MAKKIQTQIDQRPTELIQSKQEFVEVLEPQISKGEEILNRVINTTAEFANARQDFSDWNSYNSEFLKQAFNKEYNEYKREYDDAGTFSWGIISTGGRDDSPAEQLEKFRNKVSSKIDNLKKLKAKVGLLKTSVPEIPNANTSNSFKVDHDKTQVFIVHGRDDEAKIKTARFVEKLGFTPIILHEQASKGNTIIEKIEEYSNVGFGIVLYTPCDTGALNTPSPIYRNRARQNVVFEHGYLIGKIGRKNVCALVKGDVETPNDISGVIYVHMDEAEGWKMIIAREMKNAGYSIDMNKTI